MLKTYRIIPLVFILFLFGFTFVTVAPVFAWDKSMGMRHPDRPCMKNAREKGPKFGCGPDMRSPEQIASDPYDTGVHSPMPTSTSPSGGEVAELNAKISQLEARLGEVAQLNARIAELEAENATLREQQGAPADPSGGEVGQLNAKIAELEAGSQAIVVDIANLTWDESMGMRHPARPCMDKRITAADKKCKKYQKWGWQETFGGRVPSCVRRSNTCGPDRRSAADIASDPYDKKHGPYVPDVPEPTLSAEEKLHQEEEKLHQENVRRFEYKSSAARRNACLSATGGVCLPGGGYAQQLVNKGKLHPCHQCGIQSALGREGRVGGIAAFDRIIACQQKTQTPCD